MGHLSRYLFDSEYRHVYKSVKKIIRDEADQKISLLASSYKAPIETDWYCPQCDRVDGRPDMSRVRQRVQRPIEVPKAKKIRVFDERDTVLSVIKGFEEKTLRMLVEFSENDAITGFLYTYYRDPERVLREKISYREVISPIHSEGVFEVLARSRSFGRLEDFSAAEGEDRLRVEAAIEVYRKNGWHRSRDMRFFPEDFAVFVWESYDRLPAILDYMGDKFITCEEVDVEHLKAYIEAHTVLAEGAL